MVQPNTRAITCPQCGAPVTLPEYADLALCPFCGSTLARPDQRAADAWQAPAPAPSISTAGQWAPSVVSAAPSVVPAAPPAAVPSETRTLHSLACPQCSGPLSVEAGRRILLCAHCGVRVLVYGEGGVSRWLFPQNVSQIQALHAAAKWLTDYPGIASVARNAPVRQAQLVHLPIWEHKALVAGWEFGTKLRTKTYTVTDQDKQEHMELALVEERFQDPHLQERRFFQPAYDLTSLGAARPRFSGRELLLPLVAGEVDPSSTVLEPQGTAAQIAEQGRKIAVQPASGAADPNTWMLVLRESVTLLYYPIWLVEYQSGGRPYRIVVDGREGDVNSATAPAGNARLTPALWGRVAGLAAVVVLALALAAALPAVRMAAVILAVIVCIAAVLMVLRSPSGGEVEYHEPFSS